MKIPFVGMKLLEGYAQLIHLPYRVRKCTGSRVKLSLRRLGDPKGRLTTCGYFPRRSTALVAMNGI
jgi:hypothetical protein